ncbi:MAG: helix-hairpin-helix domain-containing protein [Bacteroidota bacterium]
MKNYRYGAYPRDQRTALLAIFLGVAAVTVILTQRETAKLSDTYIAAAGNLRQKALAREATNFQPAPQSFTFDPNTVSQAELILLGLSQKQAASWLKFRGSRTDAFRQPADIGKLFVLSDDDKARLIPLAVIVQQEIARARSQVQREEQWQSFRFDPNVIQVEALQALGLSPKQAIAFVNYRSKVNYGQAFRKAEDIRRLRTLSDRQKDHLVALAEIPPVLPAPPTPTQRFRFDPNTISPDSLALLGFPAWQTKSFAKYRGSRTNTFRRATDLRRILALDSVLVEAVIPLVDIKPAPAAATPQTKDTTAAPATYAYKAKPLPPAPASFDVNASGPTAWQRLPGIGEYRAGQILKFRLQLGGFYALEQIANTPGLPDSTYQRILPYLSVGPIFRQIAINYASFTELKAHPYINRNLANVIVKNREKFGPFKGPEDLNRIRLITDENRPTLLPYFSFE